MGAVPDEATGGNDRAAASGPSGRHAELFRATRFGLYVRSGKRWECIDYCAIRLIPNRRPKPDRPVEDEEP